MLCNKCDRGQKNSHKSTFLEIEIYTQSESLINKLSVDVGETTIKKSGI